MAVTDKKPFEFRKQPVEIELIGVDFSRRVPTGSTIVAYSAATEIVDPNVVDNFGSHLVVGAASLTRKTVSAMVSLGVAGYKYRVRFTATLSDGQVKEDDVTVIVEET